MSTASREDQAADVPVRLIVELWPEGKTLWEVAPGTVRRILKACQFEQLDRRWLDRELGVETIDVTGDWL